MCSHSIVSVQREDADTLFKHFSFGHCHVSLHIETLRFVHVERIFAKMHRS